MEDSQIEWVTETLQELLDNDEWPCVKGKNPKYQLYFSSADTVQFQVDTYWKYAIEGKSVPQIAQEMNISEKATRKRIEKIRDFLAYAVTGVDFNWPYRLIAIESLVEDGVELQKALRLLATDFVSYRKYKAKREAAQKKGTWDYAPAVR